MARAKSNPNIYMYEIVKDLIIVKNKYKYVPLENYSLQLGPTFHHFPVWIHREINLFISSESS